MESYYCVLKCKKFILTRLGEFSHPHLGIRTCYVCCGCGNPVCLREHEG